MLVNNTHYWHDTTRVYVETPDTTSFGYESNRRMSFYLRLYYEYKYCLSHCGQCFFVTFTYNDKSIPYLFERPVFNYEHIRLITNGKLSKVLSRQYGSRLKYLCACESGDGKGVRGKGNNPHYHFIFFVYPQDINKYVKIPPIEFKHICEEVWQGKRGFCNWKYARFGSVKEGKYGIVVNSTQALKYVSKYCLKDSVQKEVESHISDCYYAEACSHVYDFYTFKRYYNYLKSRDPELTIRGFLRLFDADRFFEFRRLHYVSVQRVPVLDMFGQIEDYRTVRTRLNTFSIQSFAQSYGMVYDDHKPIQTFVGLEFTRFRKFFLDVCVPDYVSSRMSDYRNKYSGKMRCSKSLGISGLQFVLDSDTDPHFTIPEAEGLRVYKLPLYYVRHLYYTVKICPVTDNPLYILNQKGKNLKLYRLSTCISMYYRNTLDAVNTLLENNLIFHYKSDSFSVIAYARSLKFAQDYFSIVYRYAVYSIVYKHRCYNSTTPILLSDKFVFEDIRSDFDLFLTYDQFKIDYESSSVLCIFSRDSTESLFAFHPLFKDYFTIFEFLDSVNDHVRKCKSDIKRAVYEDTATHQKVMNAYANS